MAYTNVAVVQSSPRGAVFAPAACDASNGNKFSNDGRTLLYVENGGADSATVTIDTPATVGGLAVAQNAITLSAGQGKICGPFPPEIYNQPRGATDEGCVRLSFSGTGAADVDVAVFRNG